MNSADAVEITTLFKPNVISSSNPNRDVIISCSVLPTHLNSSTNFISSLEYSKSIAPVSIKINTVHIHIHVLARRIFFNLNIICIMNYFLGMTRTRHVYFNFITVEISSSGTINVSSGLVNILSLRTFIANSNTALSSVSTYISSPSLRALREEWFRLFSFESGCTNLREKFTRLL